MVFTCIWLAVIVPGATVLRRRQSAGSRLEVAAELVDVRLEGEPRLRRAVPALGAAGRLVGEDAHAVEAIARDLVGHGLQRARVVEAGHAVAAVPAAVERGAEVHRGDASRPS